MTEVSVIGREDGIAAMVSCNLGNPCALTNLGSLHKKCSFPLRISSVNVTKSADSIFCVVRIVGASLCILHRTIHLFKISSFFKYLCIDVKSAVVGSFSICLNLVWSEKRFSSAL